MGMDQASLFHKWKDAKKISELVSLVVFERIGYQTNKNLNKYNFIKLELIASDDASSDIRNGKLHALLPEVLKYIVINGIYFKFQKNTYLFHDFFSLKNHKNLLNII